MTTKKDLKNIHNIPKIYKKGFFTTIKIAFYMFKDFFKGKYPTPWRSITAIILTFIYIISPIDIIPDIIVALGFIDDAIIFSFMLKLIQKDTEKYQIWKNTPTN